MHVLNSMNQKIIFEFMIDFHTLMERINQKTTGCDSLMSLRKLYKHRLKIMAEVLAMISFEVLNPRFLRATGTHTVINTKVSYFAHITSYVK